MDLKLGPYRTRSGMLAIVEKLPPDDMTMVSGRIWRTHSAGHAMNAAWWMTHWDRDGDHHSGDSVHNLDEKWSAEPPDGCDLKPEDIRWFPDWCSGAKLNSSTLEPLWRAMVSVVSDFAGRPYTAETMLDMRQRLSATMDTWARSRFHYEIVGRDEENILVARPAGTYRKDGEPAGPFDWSLEKSPEEFGLGRMTDDEKRRIGLVRPVQPRAKADTEKVTAKPAYYCKKCGARILPTGAKSHDYVSCGCKKSSVDFGEHIVRLVGEVETRMESVD